MFFSSPRPSAWFRPSVGILFGLELAIQVSGKGSGGEAVLPPVFERCDLEERIKVLVETIAAGLPIEGTAQRGEGLAANQAGGVLENDEDDGTLVAPIDIEPDVIGFTAVLVDGVEDADGIDHWSQVGKLIGEHGASCCEQPSDAMMIDVLVELFLVCYARPRGASEGLLDFESEGTRGISCKAVQVQEFDHNIVFDEKFDDALSGQVRVVTDEHDARRKHAVYVAA